MTPAEFERFRAAVMGLNAPPPPQIVKRVLTEPTPPLVAGSIFGIRQFRVGRDGQVLPLTDQHIRPWLPGWNTAECPRLSKTRDSFAPLGRFAWMLIDEDVRRVSPPAPAADVATKCMCGFHAYTDESPVWHHGDDLVTGIVEGAGVTVEAERGFRSQRARIVAVVSPRNPTWVGTVVALTLCFAAMLWTLISFVLGPNWLDGVLTAVNLSTTTMNVVRLRGMAKRRRPAREMARTFDVPVFRTSKDAIRAFPLGLAGSKGDAP